MKTRYTKDGLLIISEEVVETFIRDYDQRKKEGIESMEFYISEMVNKILKENSSLIPLLKKIKKDSEKSISFNNFCYGLLSMYDLFIRQTEVNKLERDLNCER